MLLQFILVIILGILAGTITGLFPGIHVNLIAVIILSSISLPFFTTIPPIIIVVFIVSMSITHTFLDFIPSIFLGAPEEDSFLSILPGHNLLLKGQGHKAVLLTLYGSLISLIPIVLFIPIFIFILPSLQSLISPILPYILIFFSLYLIFRESEFLIALSVFLLSGFLGLITLQLPIKSPLLPLLTGLFGLSTLLISINNKITLPKQKISSNISLTKYQIFKIQLTASLTAPFASFLPGFGSGQAAVISSEISNTSEIKSPEQFLFLVGSINTIVMALSFITIFSIQKTRTGTASAVLKILHKISPEQLLLIILTILISGIIAFFLGRKISIMISQNIFRIKYKYISIFIIIILISLNAILSNPLGILVLITSTALGIFCISSNIKRINLMGALIIPTILFYLI